MNYNFWALAVPSVRVVTLIQRSVKIRNQARHRASAQDRRERHRRKRFEQYLWRQGK